MSQRSSWRRAKRSRKSGGSSSATQEMDQAELDMLDMLELIDAKKQKDALAAPVKSGDLVYDMMDKGAREELGRQLWEADFEESLEDLRAANSELVSVLYAPLANTYTTEDSMHKKAQLVDGMLLNLVRGQSEHKVPLMTAALSILCECNKTTRECASGIKLASSFELLFPSQ